MLRLMAAVLALVLATGLPAASAATATAAAAASSAPKVLRYAFEVAETSFDPARINDVYSHIITGHIFESLYTYDHLARPVKIKPLTADGMPEVSADFRTWTFKVKPGIYFADDPAFKGKKRELTAADYVYTFKRFADPANRSPEWSDFEELDITGLNALRREAETQKKPFDYDRTIEGLRTLDRYTLQFKMRDPRPTFIEIPATRDSYGAVAREVVEFYGDHIGEHPVGTGPFKLAQWRRSSLIALDRNPDYRELFYDAEPAADDAEGQALLARFKGRRLPMIDRVEVSIIEEPQPRWLSFANGEADYLDKLAPQFVNVALPGGKVAPNLTKRGIRAYVTIEPGTTYTYFNMEDPIVGGYTPDKVALRRAISLGMDTEAEIRVVRNGRAVPTESIFLPYTTGFIDKQKTGFSDYDPARAQALLDLYGYVDKDGDGWRDMPDGSPLVLRQNTQPSAQNRQLVELMRKNMDAIRIRSEFPTAKWPENMKAARVGGLQMWGLGSVATRPDGQDSLSRYASSHIVGGGNYARFKLPAMDALIERAQTMTDSPERNALFAEANKLAAAYMPYRFQVTRILTDMSYPWLVGYKRPIFWRDWWQYVDIDDSQRPR